MKLIVFIPAVRTNLVQRHLALSAKIVIVGTSFAHCTSLIELSKIIRRYSVESRNV